MATKIVTKNSSTASAVPTASDLVQGELAVNVADKRLFTEDNGGAIVELGVNPAAEITANAGIALPDNQKATFGASDDLEIYHDGSNSVIKDSGTGDLRIGGSTNVQIWNDATSKISANFNGDGAATLYNNGSAKLSTTSTGIDVTGTATMDGLTVDGAAQLNGDLTVFDATGDPFVKLQTSEQQYVLRIDNSESDVFQIRDATNSANRLAIAANGDINLGYEDTGTTPKLFWDASAESLGIGTSSPQKPLHINSGTGNIGVRVESSDATSSIEFMDSGTTSTSTSARVGGISNDFFVQTNGLERMRIDSSGNVGIGNAVASTLNSQSGYAKLAVGTGSGENGATIYSGSNGVLAFANGTSGTSTYKGFMIYAHGDNSMRFGTNAAERMRIDASGNVGIGKTPDTNFGGYVLQLNGGSQTFMSFGNSTVGTTLSDGLVIGCDSAGADIYQREAQPLRFHTSNTERMRIDSSGNLSVGTTSSAGKLTVRQDSTTASPLFIVNAAISGKFATFEGNGAVHGSITWSGSTTSYNTSSDQRLKENIADADDAGSKIDAIQVRKYDWKADGSHQDYGMIAQELLEVAPEAVSQGETEEEMMGVDYSKLVPMLIKEIQSLRNRVAQLEE